MVKFKEMLVNTKSLADVFFFIFLSHVFFVSLI